MQNKLDSQALEQMKQAQRIALAYAQLQGIISAIEASETYNIPPSTVRKACADGKIPSRKTGRDWIMRKVDAESLWGKKES